MSTFLFIYFMLLDFHLLYDYYDKNENNLTDIIEGDLSIGL